MQLLDISGAVRHIWH